MARRVRDRAIETREARRKLKGSGKPYWRAIGKGLHVGYRKGRTSGVWVVRRYLGTQNYSMHAIAEADDVLDADGETVLDFWQAQEAARNLRPVPKRAAYTVSDAVRDMKRWEVLLTACAFQVPTAQFSRPTASLLRRLRARHTTLKDHSMTTAGFWLRLKRSRE